jgi:hypothetical protein
VGALALVGGERGGALEFLPRLVRSAQAGEQLGPDGGQQVIAAQGRVVGQRVDDRATSPRSPR